MRKTGKTFVAAVAEAVEALEASALRAINNSGIAPDKFQVRYILDSSRLPKKNGKIICHIFPPYREEKIRRSFLDEGFFIEKNKKYGEFFSKTLHIEIKNGWHFQIS